MINKQPLDLSYLKAISNGNKDFELKMLKTFAEQTGNEIKEIKKSFQDKRWDSLYGSVHKIKPSFHFIGELETEKLLQTIEDITRQKNNLQKLPSLIGVLLKSCKEILEKVKIEIENRH